MAVYLLEEIGLQHPKGSYDDKFVREYMRVFQAFTDTKLIDPYAVLQSCWNDVDPPLPFIYDSHPSDPDILVKKIDVEGTEDGLRWILNVRYSSDAADVTRQANNPLDEAPVVSFAQEDWEEALQADAAGFALTNSAGDFFDPPPTARRSRIIMTLTQNQPFYNPSEVKEFVNKVNGEPFLGNEMGTVYCRSIQTAGPRAYKNSVVYWPVSYVFAIAEIAEHWQYRPLDAGKFYQISSPGGVRATAVIGGGVVSVTVTSRGFNYPDAPSVSFAGGGGSGATAIPVFTEGRVTEILVTNPGAGYTSAPTVVITPNNLLGTTFEAEATAAIGGTVLSVLVNSGGTGLTAVPTILFSSPPPPGVRAAGTVTVVGGVVTAVTITNAGSGYRQPPTITFFGGGAAAVTIRQRFVDFYGRLLQDGLLDGNGYKLIPPASPVFLNFDLYELADFNDLGLNLNI